MRFSDHRAETCFTAWNLTGLLRGTKTTGTDKSVTARPVRVDAESFISSPPVALGGLASAGRDGSLSEVLSHSSWSLRELSADGAQVRPGLRHSASSFGKLVNSKGAKILTAEATVFWSCTAALMFPKRERDYLAGWLPQGSVTYARTAELRSSTMQESVSRAIAKGQSRRAGNNDPAGPISGTTPAKQLEKLPR